MHIDKNLLISIIVAPIIVGIILAFFQFGLPVIFEKKSEISYSIGDPIINIDKETMGNIDVRINNVSTPRIVGQPVHIWNSGGLPIEKLPITYVFNSADRDFVILAALHSTKPLYEFGAINLTSSNNNTRRYIYDLLNPKDEFIITFLVNDYAQVDIYSKKAGLVVRQDAKSKNYSEYVTYFGMIIAFLSAIITIISFGMGDLMRRKKELEIEKRAEELQKKDQ
jgi:hypothetical protein